MRTPPVGNVSSDAEIFANDRIPSFARFSTLPICYGEIADGILREAVEALAEGFVVNLLPHVEEPLQRFFLCKHDFHISLLDFAVACAMPALARRVDSRYSYSVFHSNAVVSSVLGINKARLRCHIRRVFIVLLENLWPRRNPERPFFFASGPTLWVWYLPSLSDDDRCARAGKAGGIRSKPLRISKGDSLLPSV
jgi:hypothetical protein